MATLVVAGGPRLLHGMGFAGALAETGLPQSNVPLALLFFGDRAGPARLHCASGPAGRPRVSPDWRANWCAQTATGLRARRTLSNVVY